MNSNDSSTPRPWRANEHGDIFDAENNCVAATFDIGVGITHEQSDKVSTRIVRAVNNHELMKQEIEVLKEIIRKDTEAIGKLQQEIARLTE